MTVESSLSEQDQSMSLLSVHMDLDGACQHRKSSQSLEDMEKQEQLMATGGRCFTLVRLWCNVGGLFVSKIFLPEWLTTVFVHIEREAGPAVDGGNAGEEAQAAAGRKESKGGSC